MPKRRRLFLFIFFILLVAAGICWWLLRGPKPMPADVTSSNGSHYSMQLWNDMGPAHLNDSAASLEYASLQRELYLLVIDESKAKIISFGLDYDLETYMKIATRTLDNEGVYVNKPLTINGYSALQTEIRSGSKWGNVRYKLTCIETPNYFYQVLAWSGEKNYEKNKADMDKMISSFKEVEK